MHGYILHPIYMPLLFEFLSYGSVYDVSQLLTRKGLVVHTDVFFITEDFS